MKFKKLLNETEKAYLFLGWDKMSEHWMPKSVCHIEKQNIHLVLVNVAPFKYSEITGVIPQSLDSFSVESPESISDMKDYDIIELPNFSLYEGQINAVIQAKRMSLFCLNGQMRTGKTVIVGTIAYSRYKADIIDKFIVIAPLRAKSSWDKHILDIPFEFYAIEHFSNEHTRYNIELNCNGKTMVYLDESHKIKNDDIVRTDIIIEQTQLAGYKAIGTGTLIGKHAGDLFWQFRFLSPDILGYPTYQYMSDTHLLYGGREGRKVVGYTNIEEFSRKVSPYIIKLTREDVGNEREKIKEVKRYYLDDSSIYDRFVEKHQKYYDENKHNLILGYLTKMQQCASGFLFEDDKVNGYIDNGRLRCLKSVINKTKGKIAIFYKYTQEAVKIQSFYKNAEILKGGLSQLNFDSILKKYNESKSKIIIIQQSVSVGFELNVDTVIYYSTTFDLITRNQSEDRACVGCGKPLKVIDIVAKDTIDERIQEVINLKSDICLTFKKELDESKSRCKSI